MVTRDRDALLSSTVKDHAHLPCSLEVNELLRHLELASWHFWEQQLGILESWLEMQTLRPHPRPTESQDTFTKISR